MVAEAFNKGLIPDGLDKDSDEYQIHAQIVRQARLNAIPALKPLLEKYELVAGIPIEEMDLKLQENKFNEALTQFFSGREGAKYIKDNVALQRGLNDPVLNLFNKTMSQGRGVKNDGLKEIGKNVFETMANMDDQDLLDFTHNHVYGPHERKSEEQIKAQEIGIKIRNKAKEVMVNAFNNDNNLRSEELRSIFVGEVRQLAKAEGVDARVIQRDTHFAVGRNSSVGDYQGKGLGDTLMKGNDVLFDAVVEVGGEKVDVTDSFVVTKSADNKMQLREIDYSKQGEVFSQSLEGLSKKQKEAHINVNATLHTALAGLEVTENGDRKMKRYEDLAEQTYATMGQTKLGKKFGYEQKTHKVFEEEGYQNFGLGHFQDRSPLKGKIQTGDIINIEPGIFIPGGSGFRKEIQVRVTKTGYEVMGMTDRGTLSSDEEKSQRDLTKTYKQMDYITKAGRITGDSGKISELLGNPEGVVQGEFKTKDLVKLIAQKIQNEGAKFVDFSGNKIEIIHPGEKKSVPWGVKKKAGRKKKEKLHVRINEAIKRGGTLYDYGAEIKDDQGNKYNGDASRVVFFGSILPEERKVYKVNYEAHVVPIDQANARLAQGEDVFFNDIEESGDAIIKASKYAKYGHYNFEALGHFTGTKGHEKGMNTSKRNPQKLVEGMVFTREPGIYIPAGVIEALPDGAQYRLENTYKVVKNEGGK